MLNMNGQVVLITGGTSGIGLSAAQLFLKKQAKVAINGRCPERGLQALESLADFGENVFYIKGDVAQVADCQSIVSKTVEHFGRLDVVVNSAGLYLEKLIVDVDEDEYDRIMNVNVKGTYFICKYALPELRRTGGGSIINISSDAGINGNLLCTAYCASKGAITTFTKALALECAPYGIRANCVCPGDVATPMLDQQLADNHSLAMPDITNQYPLGRIAQPNEVAHVICFLASTAASFVTGAVWTVDGGLTAC